MIAGKAVVGGRLLQGPRQSAVRRGACLLDLCAERACKWVGKAEADAAAQATPRLLASELSALTKVVRRDLRRDDWPIEYRKVANTYSYRMGPEAAAIWRS